MGSAELLTELDSRAEQLVSADTDLHRTLVELRRSRGISAETVAERMGISPLKVEELERYDADPKLSTLRRYSLAIGAEVHHSVEELPELES